MILRRRQPFNRTILIGLFFTALANLVRWTLERHSAMPEDPRDAVIGLLFGLGIGCMLLGIWRMRRDDGASNRQRCA
jgi:hypothetical protein